MRTFTKTSATAPPGFFACETAGLRWLSRAGGARCAQVIDWTDSALTLEHIDSARPTRQAAWELGRGLAGTHDAGAPGFGSAPAGWSGPGFFGPLNQPLPMSYAQYDSWGRFYAEQRLRPMLDLARGGLDRDACEALSRVITRCHNGDFDDDEMPARIHGDLWSGNILWAATGAVLIDPAAHGGHRETDIAMLHLFGCPHLGAIVDGYQDVHPLSPGWQERIPLHQIYPLLAHVVLFGAGYAGQTASAASRALRIN